MPGLTSWEAGGFWWGEMGLGHAGDAKDRPRFGSLKPGKPLQSLQVHDPSARYRLQVFAGVSLLQPNVNYFVYEFSLPAGRASYFGTEPRVNTRRNKRKRGGGIGTRKGITTHLHYFPPSPNFGF